MPNVQDVERYIMKNKYNTKCVVCETECDPTKARIVRTSTGVGCCHSACYHIWKGWNR